MGRKRGGGTNRYALWKGEECIAIGTIDELAKRLGCSVKTVRWYASPAAKRRDNGRHLIAERI